MVRPGQGIGKPDDPIAATVERLLAARGAGSSICPSEVARALAPAPAWRALMPAVRDVARALARAGRLRVTQGHETLSPDEPWRGAIRLRLPLPDHPAPGKPE